MVQCGSHAFPGPITDRGMGYMNTSVPETCPTRPREIGRGWLPKEINNGKIKHVCSKCHTLYLAVITREILKLLVSGMKKHALSKLHLTLRFQCSLVLYLTHVKSISINIKMFLNIDLLWNIHPSTTTDGYHVSFLFEYLSKHSSMNMC